MLFIVGLAVVSVVLAVLPLLRESGGPAAPIGWMSQQWLAEQRASHPQ